MAEKQVEVDESQIVQDSEAQQETEEKKIGTFASLREHDFRLHWIGTTMSNAGQWLQQVSIGWVVYDITGSGTILGTINLARSIATVGLAPGAGVVIDRMGRKQLLVSTNTWLLVISLVMGLLLFFDRAEVWHLFVFTLLGGIAQAFNMPLRQTVTFDLLPRELAPNGVALIQTGWAVMRSLGPAVGGFLILWFGAGGNFLIMAGAYGLIAITIMQISFPPMKGSSRRQGAMKNFKEGLSYLLQNKLVRTFMVMSWVLPLLIIPNYMALPPIFAKDVFDGGPQVLGALMGSVGVGGIFGGLFTASLGKLERRGLVQLSALALTGLSLLAFGLTTNLWLALFFLALSGAAEMVFLTTNQTLLQLSIPDEMRGRVTSLATLTMGLSPLGAMFAGVGADLVGPQVVTVVLSSGTIAVAVIVFFTSSTVRDYRLSAHIDGE